MESLQCIQPVPHWWAFTLFPVLFCFGFGHSYAYVLTYWCFYFYFRLPKVRLLGSIEIWSYNLFFFFNFIYLFIIYFWLCWVFISVRGLSLVAASGGHSSSRCAGLSLSRPLLLRSTGSRRAGSAIVAHGPSCPRHVGSSQTRAWTRVPCIGRRIPNHCATREAPGLIILIDIDRLLSW